MGAISGQRAGRGVEGGKRAADGRIVFQGVESGIDRERQAILELVADLRALGMQRAAECAGVADAAQTQAAGSAAEKPAVRKMGAGIGKAAARAAAVKTCEAAVDVRALAERQVAVETDRPA